MPIASFTVCMQEWVTVVYHSINLFAPDRYIWMFSDAQHLLKTARNCLYQSGNGKPTRHLWNDGKYLPWQHFSKIVQDYDENGLKLCPKLSSEHTQLHSFSTMNGRLAAQTLSESTAKILREYYPSVTHGTFSSTLYLLCYVYIN